MTVQTKCFAESTKTADFWRFLRVRRIEQNNLDPTEIYQTVGQKAVDDELTLSWSEQHMTTQRMRAKSTFGTVLIMRTLPKGQFARLGRS